jgi:PqqD family protein of HPr-rel-A system
MIASENINTDSIVWRIADDAQLQLRYWDDECVLYHGASGNTHRLPELIGQMLEQLMHSAASITTLSESIDLHEDDVKNALHELAGLGITQVDQ